MKARAKAPKLLAPNDRATKMPSAKLLRLEMPWSATPQPSRRIALITRSRAGPSDRAGGLVERAVIGRPSREIGGTAALLAHSAGWPAERDLPPRSDRPP